MQAYQVTDMHAACTKTHGHTYAQTLRHSDTERHRYAFKVLSLAWNNVHGFAH